MAKVRLRSYLRPYWGCVLALVVLLFSKAAVDLNLPNLMSGIVNIGLQRGGIAETAPKVVPDRTLGLLLLFASESDKAALEASYSPVGLDSMERKDRIRFLKDWPAASEEPLLRLKAPSDEAQEAFQRVCGTMAEVARKRFAAGGLPDVAALARKPQTGLPPAAAGAFLRMMIGAIPKEEMDEARKAAGAAPPIVLEQTAAMVIKGIYADLGADMGRIQNRYILQVGARMLLMTLLLVFFTIGIGLASSRFGAGVARDLRRDIFVKTTYFTDREYDRFGIAGLITRSTNDVMQIRGLLSMGLRTLLYAPIMGIGGIVMAVRKSAGMAWIIALAAVVILCLVLVLFFVAVPRFKKMQRLVDKLNLVSRESLSGMMVIRAFSAQKIEEGRFDKANKELAANNLFVFRALATMGPAMSLVMNGVSLLIVWVGGHRIAASSMQVGDMMAFIQYTMQIIMSFLMISLMFVMVPRAVVSANRVREVLSLEASIRDPETPASPTAAAAPALPDNAPASSTAPAAPDSAPTSPTAAAPALPDSAQTSPTAAAAATAPDSTPTSTTAAASDRAQASHRAATVAAVVPESAPTSPTAAAVPESAPVCPSGGGPADEPAAAASGKARGLVEFKDVSFRYPGATEDVLSHISLAARPGETVAIVGSTGSGKSTLVDLLPRLHDATEGSILIDGLDIKKMRLKDLRRKIAYIPQKGILFSGTIASNLRLGEPEAPVEALRTAVEVSQAAEFVYKLPQGFEAPITQGGTNVSGGQRQRLSIARALVKDAPIRIFDDTFSALDFKTDALLRAALRRHGGGATTFVVAQRISTVMGADKIVVLEKGRIVGLGRHRELLESCQTYREIAQSQLPEEELA